MYSVYVHKNLKNEKYYVGCTSQEPKRRWNNGWGYNYNPQMWSDIRNSDWNKDWVHGILGKFENKQDALKYEAFLIAMLDTIENGYNTSEYGGFSCRHSEETKKRLSEANIGKKSNFYGKHHSEETRRKRSESHGVNGILQFSKDGEFIAEYSSIMEAERQTGCSHGNICACCKGTRKSCGGYIWMYTS